MQRVGDALFQLLWGAGSLGKVIVVSGIVAFPMALASLAARLLRRGQASLLGAVTLLLASLPMAVGACGTLVGRMHTDAALEGAPPGYSRERARRQGYLEARVYSQGALVVGGFPLIAGAAGFLTAIARRKPLARARAGQALAFGAVSPIALAAALLATAGAVWGARASIPDPDLEFDSVQTQ